MKQKDLTLILVIAFISAILSFFLSNKLFVTPENRQQSVEVIDPISAEMNLPDERYFNENSINPTQNSQLGNNTNQTPFNGSN